MKFIKGILFTLLGLFALLCALVMLFAFNPNLTDKLAGLLYGTGQTEASADGTTEKATETDNAMPGSQEENATEIADTNSPTGQLPTMADIVNQLPQDEQYIEPEQSQIKAPADVADKTGYQPIIARDQQIEEQEAQELVNTLGYGETGDDLTFDASKYPYYQMLDEKLQHLYRQIYANANALTQAFTPVEDVSTDQLKNAFTAVFCDQPQLFWLDTAYGAKYAPEGNCVELDLQFNNTAHSLDNNKETFNSAAEQIIAAASDEASDYDKEVAVHNAILDRNTYRLTSPLNQSAYSALVNGQTVCAGYARAMQYIMQQLGVPCYYCMGYAGESHAWNIISLDDGYYNVDATWDDTDPNTYDYFNKSDTDFNTNHKRTDLSIYLPACNGSQYSNLEENPESMADSNGVDSSAADSNATDQNTTDGNATVSNGANNDGSQNGNSTKGDTTLRALADAGFSESDVLHTLDDYYADCEKQIEEKGLGNYAFQNVIADRSLYNELYLSYKNQDYKSAYAEKAMKQLGAQNFNLKMRIEEMSNGELLLTHQVTVQ